MDAPSASTVISIIFALAGLLMMVMGIVFGVAFCVFGMLPYGIVNGFLALTGNERRMGFWAVPYVGWGGSIVGLTLLSAVANWQTGVDYGGDMGAWGSITLIEGAVAVVGIALAWRAHGKQLSRARELREAGADVINPSARAYIYWVLWLVGILAFNWIMDMIYVVDIGVDIQGIGPGWIDLVDVGF